jgi:hypothetical protein
MKALTICQPYADMIAKGEKPIENRTWPTAYRGPLAIHAGKSRAWLDDGDEAERPGMVYGAIVATAMLVDCVRVTDLPAALQASEHANGPWCWILDEIYAFVVPVYVKGAQGLWEWRHESPSQ